MVHLSKGLGEKQNPLQGRRVDGGQGRVFCLPSQAALGRGRLTVVPAVSPLPLALHFYRQQQRNMLARCALEPTQASSTRGGSMLTEKPPVIPLQGQKKNNPFFFC